MTAIARRALLAGIALLPGLPAFAQSAVGQRVSGTWTGVLDLGARRLRLRLVLPASGNPLLYSLDQSPEGMAGEGVSLTRDRIDVRFASINAVLTGRLDALGQIEGLFVQGGPVPIILAPGDGAPVWPALTKGRLEEWRKAAELPAIAAIASRRGGETQAWQAGERAAGSGISIAPDDHWHLGSNTKSMTATLVARLVEKGLVDWDDTVGSALATVAPQMREAYREVTFSHLLSHRSGLPANIPQPDLLKFAQVSADVVADRRAYAIQALGMEPRGSKEATYEYSNSGYIVAAAMLEAKLGQTWESLIRAHVFEPLKLASAGFGPPGDGDPSRQPVRHLNRRPNAVGVVPDNPAVLGPAGRVHMSLPDLALYLAAHRDRPAFLKTESWERLHTPPFGGDYALGWIVKPDGTRWHNGTNGQWYAAMEFNSRAGLVTAAASNDAIGQAVIPAVMTCAAKAV